MKNADLKDLLITKINVLYDVEHALIKALPKMAKAATNPDLKSGFNDHLAETKMQAERLEKIHSLLGEKPKKLKSEGIRGIIEDGEWVIKNIRPAEALDANLARAAQYVEHYEMAGYMAAISWAQELDENEIAELLNETLQEEVAADEKLKIAAEKLQKELVI